jgi:hypothetical protein
VAEEFRIALSDCRRPDFAYLGFDWSFHQAGFDLALPFRFTMQPVAKGHERRIRGATITLHATNGE